MTFSQYFKTSSYCLIASGFIAMVSAGVLGWISILLFSAVLTGSWFMDTVRFRERIPNRILNAIMLAYLPVFVIDQRLLSHSIVTSVAHLLLIVTSVKLLTLSKDRDFVVLYLISFVELLAGSTLTVNIVFNFCLFVFLFSGVIALILFEMRRSNARIQGEAGIKPLVVPRKLRGTGLELFSPFPASLLSASALGITVFLIACAAPLFFLLPRVTLGPYKQPSGNTQFVSGFSDRVELGRIGAIKQSSATVMRVKTDKPPFELPTDFKWRGLSFDYFDGRAWSRSNPGRTSVPEQGWYYKLQDSAQGTDWVNQTFFVEALSTNVVFAMPRALAISKDVGSLQRDAVGNLYTSEHLHKKLRYSAVSDPVHLDPRILIDREPMPPDRLKIYLQLPSSDPRIEELAKRVTKAAKSRFAKAQALEHYLRLNYAYSLILGGSPNAPDPLAAFLFDVRKGHCEYFASAMTVMLRQLGIPARLVNGFRSGEYNDIGDNWIVRQYDAHSWVEAYFPPYGWIEFDPTPAVPRRPKRAFVRVMSNLADAIDLWWWEHIVNYDSLSQYRTLTALRAKMDDFGRRAQHSWEFAVERSREAAARFRSPHVALYSFRNAILWVPWIAVGILLTVKPFRKRVLRLARLLLHRRNPRAKAAGFYMEALDLLRSHGMKRRMEQTPMEFVRSLESHPAAIPLLALTRIYNAVRFGPPETSFSSSEAETLLRLLRLSLQ